MKPVKLDVYDHPFNVFRAFTRTDLWSYVVSYLHGRNAAVDEVRNMGDHVVTQQSVMNYGETP